jgi:hypothetical protein
VVSKKRARANSYTPEEQRVAAEIAGLLLAGGGVAAASAVAPLLLPLLPTALLANPTLSADVTAATARQVVAGPIGAPRPGEGPLGLLERTSMAEALLYRGFYAVAALRRIVAGALDSPEAMRAAVDLETHYFAAHTEARHKWITGARQTDSARDMYGVVVGWYHLNPTEDPRPDHMEAHGNNFRADVPTPPASTGVWPGVLLHCGCVAGPPWRDGNLLAA